MGKRTIVHIIPSLMKGGSERFVVDLCNELSIDQNQDIHLVSLYQNDTQETFRRDILPRVKYHQLNKKSGFDRRVIFSLAKLLDTLRPSVIHTHLNALEYMAYYKLLHPRLKVYHTIHNDAFKEVDIPVFRKIRKVFYRFGMIRPVTISRESSASYQECYRLKNDVMIENGRKPVEKTDHYEQVEEAYHREPGEQVLLNVGRICKQKNQRLFIDAVNALALEGRPVRGLIIGEIQEPELYEGLQQVAGPAITFLGGKNNVADYLLIADAFCLSSDYEGMPISLIESFSAGCIPVCTAVGGVKEMIQDGENGFLSNDLTTESYKTALKRCLDIITPEKMRLAGKIVFQEKYHISITAAKYQQLYDR